MLDLLLDHTSVEAHPIIEIVEVHRIEESAVVFDAIGSENFLTHIIGVVVAYHARVECFESCLVELTAFLLKHPCLKLRISWLTLHKCAEYFFIEAESIEKHLVVATADRRVFSIKLARYIEGNFLPKAWEVKNAERATCA